MGHPATPLRSAPEPAPAHLPQPAIPVGSRVAYRDQQHKLEEGIIQAWTWKDYCWQAQLSNNTLLEADRILSVGYLNDRGETIGAELWPPRTSAPVPTYHPPTTQNIWLKRFERIRDLTLGLSADDPRFPIINGLIDQCTTHYQRRDEQAFIATGKRIAALMNS